MKLLRNFSRLLIGTVFIFSGFVKAIDPLGSAYKFTDYFIAFHMDWLSPAAMFFSVMLSALEFAIGFALLNNVLPKITSLAMYLFMSFFTILTLYSALSNPVSDCGCFGDALVLTNWQTFYKNLILMLPASLVFFQRKHFEPRFLKGAQLFILIFGVILSLYISKHSYNHLPPVDFRPYKIGTNINLARNENLQGAPLPDFETTIIYKKGGKRKSFSVENLPDSTWTWVKTKNQLVSPGYIAPIHDFSLTNDLKQDVTDMVLQDSRFTLMVVSYDLSNINAEQANKIKELNDMAGMHDHQFLIATASNPKDVHKFQRTYGIMTNIYTMDPITLKTIVRSNPGLVLLKEGLILNKWHFNDFPDAQKITQYDLYNSSLKHRQDNTNMLVIGSIFLWLLVAALIEITGLKAAK